jgi:large subunit ribosomal protein L29
MLKISEISTLDSKAINQKVSELRRELFDMRLQRSTTNIEKTHLFRENKKDIARLLTVLNSKESK